MKSDHCMISRAWTLVIGCLIGVGTLMCPLGCHRASDFDQALVAIESDQEVQGIIAKMQQRDTPELTASIWRSAALFDPRTAMTSRGDEVGQFWRRFRDAYPFGIQGVAMSNIDANGSCSVVIAEPPPHVSLDDLRAVIPDAAVFRKRLGHDGALYDVAGTLSGGAKKIGAIIRKLNNLLYWTDYKAFVYKEPFNPSALNATAFNVNVNPTSEELLAWISAADSKFVVSGSDEVLTYKDLQARSDSFVSMLDSKNLVMWWIPSGIIFEKCVVQARQFALDSDLIVGAVQSNGLLLCARKRVAPYDVLPPLRTETLALLAAVKSQDHLFQTYNDAGPGAGIYDTTWNWSSISMSSELLDTEYGNLLNVADQTIKGWSEGGETVDQGFEHYPKPRKFPFNNTPLSKVVSKRFGKNSVTFNWNTKGSGHVVSSPSGKAYSPGVTGSLSVSYIPGQDPKYGPEVVPLEEEAYRYFSTRGDAIIARVNQYTSIFQIFHNLSGPSVSETPPKITRLSDALEYCSAALVKQLNGYTDSDLSRLADSDPLRTRLERSSMSKDANIPRALYSLVARQTLKEGFQVWKGLADDDKAMIGPSQYPKGLENDQLDLLSALMFAAGRDIDGPKIIEARTRPDGKSWVHTQAIAMTNAGPNEPTAIGGHNLDAPLKLYKVSGDLAPGEVRVAEDGTVTLSKDCESKVASIQREFDRTSSEGETTEAAEIRLKALLAKVEPTPIRSPDIALGVADIHNDFGGFSRESVSIPTVFNYTPPTDVVNAMRSVSPRNVVVVKSGNYFWVGGRGSDPVPVSNMGDAVDATIAKVRASGGGFGGGSEPPDIEFKNFDEGNDEWKSFMAEVRRKGGRGELPNEVLAVFGRNRTRVNLADYELGTTKIEVGEIMQESGKAVQTIDFRLQPKVATVKECIIRVVIWFREAASVATQKLLAKVLVGRWAQIMKGSATLGEDPVKLYAREIRRLQDLYHFDFDIHVTSTSDDWRIVDREVNRVAVAT